MQRRWGASEIESTAAARLLVFPKTLGDWETLSEEELGVEYGLRWFPLSLQNPTGLSATGRFRPGLD